MTSLDWRYLPWLVIPLAAAACTEDTVPFDTETTATSAADSSSGGTPTTSPPATDTTDGGEESSDGGATSTGAASSSSDGGPATDDDTSATTDECVSVCGNNMIECDEVCDLAQLGGETCVSQGAMGGMLGCNLTCDAYNTLGCFICGNGVVDLAEDCEGVVPEGIDCESMGFEGGILACGGDCLWDTTECSICGDGIQQGFENCDGLDLGGETCMSLGFTDGTLGCQPGGCGFDYSGCSGGMYIQDFEAGAPLPLEFTTGGAADWVVDGMNPVNGSFSAWSTDLGEGQNNFMQLTALFAVAGDVSFWHEESSEGSFDFLEFYIDGVLIDSWSGINPPTMDSYPIGAGMHTLEWRYDKDGIVSVGSDSVWVDDITLVPGVPI